MTFLGREQMSKGEHVRSPTKSITVMLYGDSPVNRGIPLTGVKRKWVILHISFCSRL